MGDSAKGYSIRRVDLEEEDDNYDAADDTDEQQQQVERRMPPAVLRLEAPHDGAKHFAAAFGSKIMALHDTRRRYVPVFDVRSRCLTFGPPLSRDPFAPIYVPIGSDKLFCLDYDVFEVLHQPPPPIDPYRIKIVPKWLPWRRLSWPPFNHDYVTSQCTRTGEPSSSASPPVSGGARQPNLAPAADEDDLGSWMRHGVPPPTTDDGKQQHQQQPPPPPAWKLSKEKLFWNDPAEKHGGATLVHLAGGRSNRFCLVQCLSLDDREEGVYKEDLPERARPPSASTHHLLRTET